MIDQAKAQIDKICTDGRLCRYHELPRAVRADAESAAGRCRASPPHRKHQPSSEAPPSSSEMPMSEMSNASEAVTPERRRSAAADVAPERSRADPRQRQGRPDTQADTARAACRARPSQPPDRADGPGPAADRTTSRPRPTLRRRPPSQQSTQTDKGKTDRCPGDLQVRRRPDTDQHDQGDSPPSAQEQRHRGTQQPHEQWLHLPDRHQPGHQQSAAGARSLLRRRTRTRSTTSELSRGRVTETIIRPNGVQDRHHPQPQRRHPAALQDPARTAARSFLRTYDDRSDKDIDELARSGRRPAAAAADHPDPRLHPRCRHRRRGRCRASSSTSRRWSRCAASTPSTRSSVRPVCATACAASKSAA